MSTTARRWVAGAALAALVIGVELAASLSTFRWHGAPQSKPGTFGIILLVTGGLALLARRRYPGAVLAVVLGTTLGANALGARGAWFALIVAFFTAVLRGRRVARGVSHDARPHVASSLQEHPSPHRDRVHRRTGHCARLGAASRR